ncbi:hypothetical protein V491_07555 [Pseudogymnoascus sp. VKM F-3775]|nr:hypothetical protein V491_07555 [Pseudogymnoascus sp. VKM F-3775]
MLIPIPKSSKRRLSISEIDESPSIDAAIDIFQKSQSSIIVSLPQTGCFDILVQRVEETMALMDKRGISLAHKAKRRRTISRRLSERKCGVKSGDNFPLSETAIRDNTSPALSLGFETTKSNPDRIQKQTLVPLLKGKQSREATDHFSPILREMISEVEAERQNTITTRREYGATESDDQPETLVVEREYSPRKIRILRAPGKKGGYIIANCRNSDWMLDLGVRLEREEKANKVRDERGGLDIRWWPLTKTTDPHSPAVSTLIGAFRGSNDNNEPAVDMPPFKAPVKDVLATSSILPYKQFVLFGDSITQGAFDQSRGFALGAQLAHDYIRRLDIVNRGLNGYQTEQGLAVIDYVFPSPTSSPKIEYLSLFFGANDSANDGGASKQLVSIERYRENLLSILSHPSVLAHNPRIILVTTPPVDEYQRPEETRPNGQVDRGRCAENSKAYAQVGKEVGEELIAKGRPVVVCDLWAAMMARAGWTGEGELPGSLKTDRNPALAEMLYDGLHFNPVGYKVLYDEMRKVMADTWPDSDPESVEKHFPEYGAWF